MRESDKKGDAYNLSKRLLYYPFILVICWIWGSISRI